MKTKLIILILSLINVFFKAQIIYSTESRPAPAEMELQDNEIASIFSGLDKSRIPTGLLADAAVEFADLEKYNGTVSDSSYTTSGTIVDIYNTLIMSRLSENAEFTKAPIDLPEDWRKAERQDLIPIGGVFYQYSRISDIAQQSAKSGGEELIKFNGNLLEDKYANGVWQNPYEIQQVFALAPAGNSFNKLDFKVVLPNDIFLSNGAANIQTIEYRTADDRTYQALPFNQPIPVSYNSEGSYTWTFRLTLNSGEQLYTHTKFEVKNLLDKYDSSVSPSGRSANLESYTKVYIEPGVIQPAFPWQQPVATAKATLYIKLAAGRTRITKPLIVAEGFDLGSYISPYKEGGTNNVEDFVNSLKYKDSNGFNNTIFKDYITSDYDIIYVDWGNGTDYIQNNAAYFEKAIEYVNSVKIPREKNVVIGQSMGGLVARWALKNMEDKGQNHDTRLFISHDAPHLGANIPVGLQQMLASLYHQYIKSPGLAAGGQFILPLFYNGLRGSDFLTMTNAPAARQMLINYINPDYQVDNSAHINWQNALRAKGYPQLTRNVAISNGNECGTDQNLEDILRIQKETGNAHYFSDAIASILGGFLGRLDLITLGSLPGSSKYTFDVAVRPMRNLNENKQLYYANIKYKKKIFWLINSQITLLNASSNQPSGVLPIDKYSGSQYILTNDNPTSSLMEGVSIHPFGFVPTVSSLDYKSGTVALSEADYQKSFSPSTDIGTVPFINWVVEPAAFGKHQHITFSERIGDFIKNQLGIFNQDEKISTAWKCGNKTLIGGDPLLCPRNTGTFTTGFAPNVSWYITSGADLVEIVGATNSPQVSIKAKDGASGYVALKANLSDGSSGTTINKSLWVGAPKIYLEQQPTTYNRILLNMRSMAPEASLADMGIASSSNLWRRMDNNVTKTGGTSYSFFANPYDTPEIEVQATTTNSCGTYTASDTFYPSVPQPCDPYQVTRIGGDDYTVSRAPETPCLSNRSAAATSRSADIFDITVLNSISQTVLSTRGNTFTLSGMLPGTYYVRVIKDGELVTSKTIIKN